jgi:hypothetical protein
MAAGHQPPESVALHKRPNGHGNFSNHDWNVFGGRWRPAGSPQGKLLAEVKYELNCPERNGNTGDSGGWAMKFAGSVSTLS